MAATPRKIARIQNREAKKNESVEVRLLDLLNGQPALNTLAMQPLKAKLAFRLSRVIREVKAELDLFTTQHRALLSKYGTEPEGDATEWGFETFEKRAAFEAEYKDLVESEITLAVAPIHIDELAEVRFASADLAMLHWLVTE